MSSVARKVLYELRKYGGGRYEKPSFPLGGVVLVDELCERLNSGTPIGSKSTSPSTVKKGRLPRTTFASGFTSYSTMPSSVKLWVSLCDGIHL